MKSLNGWRTLPSGKNVRTKRIKYDNLSITHRQMFHDTSVSPWKFVEKYYSDWFATQPWTHFLTLTFRNMNYRDGVKPPSYTYVKEQADALEYYSGWDQAVIVLEQGKLPFNDQASETPLEVSAVGRYHLHGLARFKDQKDVSSFCAMWELKNGFAKAEVIREVEAVSKYCSKYVVKDNLLEDDKFQRMWFNGVTPWKQAGLLPPLEAPRG